MSRPSRATRPEVAESSPVTTLNNVVLPAPLGPIRPVTRPGSSVSDRPTTASLPPNRTWMPTTASCYIAAAPGQDEPALAVAVGAVVVGEGPVEADELVGHT